MLNDHLLRENGAKNKRVRMSLLRMLCITSRPTKTNEEKREKNIRKGQIVIEETPQ